MPYLLWLLALVSNGLFALLLAYALGMTCLGLSDWLKEGFAGARRLAYEKGKAEG